LTKANGCIILLLSRKTERPHRPETPPWTAKAGAGFARPARAAEQRGQAPMEIETGRLPKDEQVPLLLRGLFEQRG